MRILYTFCLLKYILFLSSPSNVVFGTVVISTKPGVEYNGSGAQLTLGARVPLMDLTVCWRFYEFPNPNMRYLINSMTRNKEGKDKHIFGFNTNWAGEEERNGFNFLGYWMPLDVSWLPMEWNHVCFSYTNSTSNARIVSNGDIILDETMEYLKQNPEEIPDEFIKNLVIMRRYFPYKNDFFSMVGKMTDVIIWNISMTTQDMKSWTHCNYKETKNIIKWDVEQWSLTELEKINGHSFCKNIAVEMKIFVKKSSFFNSLDFCNKLGGSLTVADSSNKSQEMMRIGNDNNCGDVWAGYSDIKKEGKFKDVNTGVDMQWSNWGRGEPNGKRRQNCVHLWMDGKLDDEECEKEKSKFCDIQRPSLNLRGACINEQLDVNYVMQLDTLINENHNIVGFKKSSLLWQGNKWIFFNGNGKKVAFTNDTSDYPLGTHRWYFNSGKCHDPGEKWRKLNLNSCKNTEFPCTNGECVDMELRCDKNYNCNDYSDEEKCDVQTTSTNEYNKKATPKIKVTDGIDSKTDIKISIHILDILEINEIESKVSFKFEFSTTWKDSRLEFISLSNDTNKNVIEDPSGFLWTPKIDFINTVLPKRSNLEETDIFVSTLKQGTGYSNKNDELFKNTLYLGSENELIKISSFVGSFVCTFANIKLYPFDNERCFLHMTDESKNYYFTNLIPSKFEYSGPMNVGPYIIMERKKMIKTILQNKTIGIQIEINLGRQINSILLSTYLPTMLMNSINQATNYFQGEDMFGDKIAINLTCMMVLSALYISVSGSLPATASIKYVEIWLLFSLIYPFLMVLAQTGKHLAKTQSKNRKQTNSSQRNSRIPILIPKQAWNISTSSLEATKTGIGTICLQTSRFLCCYFGAAAAISTIKDKITFLRIIFIIFQSKKTITFSKLSTKWYPQC